MSAKPQRYSELEKFFLCLLDNRSLDEQYFTPTSSKVQTFAEKNPIVFVSRIERDEECLPLADGSDRLTDLFGYLRVSVYCPHFLRLVSTF